MMLRKEIINPVLFRRNSIENFDNTQSVLANAPVGIFHSSPDGMLLDVNQYLSDILGYDSPEEYMCTVNKTNLNECLYVNKEERQRFVEEVLKDNSWHKYMGKFYRKDGKIIDTEISMRASKNSDGSVNYLEGFIYDITKFNKNEALKEDDHQYRTLFNSSPDYIILVGVDGIIIDVNNAAQKITGLPYHNLIGKHFNSIGIFPNEDIPLHVSKLSEVLTGNDLKPYESRFFDNNGELHYVETDTRPLKKNGEIFAFQVISHDITERKKNEEVIKKSESYYRTIFENTGTATLILNDDAIISLVNTEFEKLSGYSKEEIENKKSWIDIVAEENRETVKNYHELRGISPEKTPNNYEIKLMNKQGQIRDIYVNIALIPYSTDRLISFLDITAKKKSKIELQESKTKLKIAMDMAKLVYWEYDVKVDMYTFDDQFYALYGTNVKKEGKTQMSSNEYAEKFIPIEESSIVGIELQKALETDDPNYFGQVEHTIKKADNEKRFITVHYWIIKDNDGNTIKVCGVNQDITERKNVEIALKESEKKYRDLAELLPQPVFESDLKGNITFINRVGLPIFGYSQEDLDNGLNIIQIIAPQDRERAIENNQKILNMEKLTFGEFTATKKDGTFFPVIVHSNPIIQENKIIGLRGVVVDITELKNAENKIKASLKDKEVLLKEVHHRVKNNMQIISSLLNLQIQYVDDEGAVNVLKESQNRVKSMAMIHEKLYMSNDLTKINFVDYIESLVSNLFYSYNINNGHIKPVLEIDEINLNMETAVPCGLIISELVSNSLKYAFPNRKQGEIAVSLKSEDNFYKLIVRDNGIGLPEDIELDNAKTLGLKLVNILTGQIDGEIEINKESGTEFTITFNELLYKDRV
jgi:PAS domain S-box-containing protein